MSFCLPYLRATKTQEQLTLALLYTEHQSAADQTGYDSVFTVVALSASGSKIRNAYSAKQTAQFPRKEPPSGRTIGDCGPSIYTEGVALDLWQGICV